MYESLKKMEKATTQLEINAGARSRVQSGWRDSKVDECMEVIACTFVLQIYVRK
jgi:hypothetical protein